MKRVLTLVTVLALGLSGMSLMGCESDNSSKLPAGERGTTAGGNGAFGENPNRPGDYNYNSNTSTDHSADTSR